MYALTQYIISLNYIGLNGFTALIPLNSIAPVFLLCIYLIFSSLICQLCTPRTICQTEELCASKSIFLILHNFSTYKLNYQKQLFHTLQALHQ